MERGISFNAKYNIYKEHFEKYNNIRFTCREVDVIACIIQNRTVQSIASLLSVSSSTIGAHLYNIRIKLGYIAKNQIIDFAEKSGKLQYLKIYYKHLVYESLFNEHLSKLHKVKKIPQYFYKVNSYNLNEQQQKRLEDINKLLAIAKIFLDESSDKEDDSRPKIEIITKNDTSSRINNIRLLFDNPQEVHNLKTDYIDFTLCANHYISLSTLIEKIINEKDVTNATNCFKEDFNKILLSFSLEDKTPSSETKNLNAIKKSYVFFMALLVIMFCFFYIRNQITFNNPSSTKVIAYNIPQLFEHFVKREELIEILKNKFREDTSKSNVLIIAGLHGLAGVGKTVLAKHFIHSFENQYSFVGWFNAETNDLLEAQYLELGEKQRLFSKDILIKNKIALVKEWLKNQQSNLIVYDNVSDINLLQEYLPNTGHIIITSRNNNIPGAIEVGILSEKESIALFDKLILKKSKQNTNFLKNIKILSHELGYLPLALSQAGSYINTNLISVEEYISLYHQKKDILLSNQTMPPLDTHLPAYVSWDLTMQRLQQQEKGKKALKMLSFVACFNESNIPTELLSEYMNGSSSDEYDIEINGLLTVLQEYSLIRRTSVNTFSIHKLVHSWISSKLLKDSQKNLIKKAISSIQNIYPKKRMNNKDKTFLVNLLPHVETLVQKAKVNLNESEYIDLFSILGNIYYTLGYYDKSLESLSSELKLNLKYFNVVNSKRFKILDSMGKVYTKLGNYEEAERLLKQSLAMKKKYYNSSNISIAHTLQYLGRVYLHKGMYDKSRTCFESSLSLQKEYYNSDSIEVAYILDNIGDLYLFTEDYQTAKEILEKSLSIKINHYGDQHVETAATMHSLGAVYLGLHKYTEAKDYLEKAVNIGQTFFGDNSGAVAYSRSYLGMVYLYLGEFDKASFQLNKSLSIRQKLYGNDHIESGFTMHNLGILNLYTKQYNEAASLLEKSILIKKKHYFDSDQHIEISNTEEVLAFVKAFQGDNLLAEKIVENSYNKVAKVYNDKEAKRIDILADHGNIHRILRNYEKSEQLLRKALSDAEKLHGSNHLTVAIILGNLGLLYEQLENNEKKEYYLKESLVILNKLLPSSHPYIIKTKELLKTNDNQKRNNHDLGFHTRLLIA